MALAASLACLAAVAAGCGGQVVKGPRQDQNEPKGKFPVRVLSATFPLKQHITKNSSMLIVVRNAGTHRIPNISVTVKCPNSGLGGSFNRVASQSDVADPERPQFVVDQIPTRSERLAPPLDPAPLERSSAFVDTYPLGQLDPGRKATFRWALTAVKAGPFRLCWRVNAGLYGNAKAVPAGGTRLSGVFKGTISDRAPKAQIANDGHTVVTSP